MFSMEDNKSAGHGIPDESATTFGTIPTLEGARGDAPPIEIKSWCGATILAHVQNQDGKFGVL